MSEAVEKLITIGLRALAHAVTRSSNRARLNILIYHRVLAETDSLLPDIVDAHLFERQMSAVSDIFNVLPLSEAVDRLVAKSLPNRSLCITFDDGYRDNVEVALPILKKHRLPATFFIATKYLNGLRMWNDTIIETVRRAPGDTLDLRGVNLPMFPIADTAQRRATIYAIIGLLKYSPPCERDARALEVSELAATDLPDNLMMTPPDVKRLAESGMGIGGHTVSHPILTTLDRPQAFDEIANCKAELEQLSGSSVTQFAYPNGKPGDDYTSEHVELVKRAGYNAAVSTAWGVSRSDTDRYQLPRFTPWNRDTFVFTMRLLQNCLR